jgi:hypothetical protein
MRVSILSSRKSTASNKQMPPSLAKRAHSATESKDSNRAFICNRKVSINTGFKNISIQEWNAGVWHLCSRPEPHILAAEAVWRPRQSHSQGPPCMQKMAWRAKSRLAILA